MRCDVITSMITTLGEVGVWGVVYCVRTYVRTLDVRIDVSNIDVE